MTTPQVILPTQLGAWAVNISPHELHTNRDDILAPTPTSEKRRLMVTVFQPTHRLSAHASSSTELLYLPNHQAHYQAESLQKFDANIDPQQLQRLVLLSSNFPSTQDDNEDEDGTVFPLIILSPGFAASRLSYAATCHALATHGYTVLSTDHTHEAEWICFPDGATVSNAHRTIRGMADVAAYAAHDHPVRVADVTSILDAVQRREIPGLRYAALGQGELRAGVLGHSLGGSTAVGALLADPRVVAAVNLDGSLQGDISTQALHPDKQLLLVSQEDVRQPGRKDATWKAFYANAPRNVHVKVVKGCKHDSFTDMPLWVDVLGIEDAGMKELAGDVEGRRVLGIVCKYAVGVFDAVFRKGGSVADEIEMLHGEYPEVVGVRDGTDVLMNGKTSFEWLGE